MLAFWTVAVVVAAWAMAMGVVIVLQRRSAAATIAWLLVLTFLPVLGLAIYRFIGPMRLERKKVRRRRTRQLVAEATGAFAAIEAQSHEHDHAALAQVGVSVGEAPPLRAESLDLYTDGASAYAAIVEAIEAARHHVHLEYYIWEPDHFGLRLLELLARRARGGIRVRLLLDAVGSHHLRRRHLAGLRQAGAEVAWFNPVRLRVFRSRRADFRSHRKIVVCDGRVGFTGGMNITDVHTSEFSGGKAWRDTHLRLVGSAVRALQRAFVDDWYFATDKLPDIGAEYFPAGDDAPAPRIVQVLASGPDAALFPIQRAFFTAINTASQRLYVTTPYFIPDEPIVAALVSAALRGVDVRMLIPRRGDSRLIDLAARSYLRELLDARVRVYEYLPRFVHAKTMAIDASIGIVGTANLDNRSFKLNFEIAALMFDRAINEALTKAFVEDLQVARELTCADLDGAPFLVRLGQAGARLVSPLL
jgi:cardiolipin synthase